MNKSRVIAAIAIATVIGLIAWGIYDDVANNNTPELMLPRP